MQPILYVLAIVAANYSVSMFGPAVTPINAFLLIGLDFALRDSIQDRYGFAPTALLVAGAGLISYALNPDAGMIAIASAASFVLANLADGSIYSALTGRSKLERSNASNAAGALVDSLLFPALAFGAFMPEISALQFAAKTTGGAVWSYLIFKVACKVA